LEEKYTYSTLMTKIVEIERRIGGFYEKASRARGGEVGELFKKYAAEARDRIDRIIQAKQMSVLEMTLETITNIPIKQSTREIEEIIKDKGMTVVEKAVEIERKILELYKMVSEKIYFMSMDAATLLDELSKKAKTRINQLQTHKA